MPIKILEMPTLELAGLAMGLALAESFTSSGDLDLAGGVLDLADFSGIGESSAGSMGLAPESMALDSALSVSKLALESLAAAPVVCVDSVGLGDLWDLLGLGKSVDSGVAYRVGAERSAHASTAREAFSSCLVGITGLALFCRIF